MQPGAPRWAKKRLASVAHISRFFAYEYGFPSMPASLRVLRELGYCPAFVVDGGAFEGTWTALLRDVFPEARSLMIEPQAAKRAKLLAICRNAPQSTRFCGELLGPKDGLEVDFHEMQTGSSVLSELSPWQRDTVRKTISTLDTVVADNADWGQPDFIKLDVQGYELAVLEGATRALESAMFVLLEASFVPYNEGAPLAAEVIAFMDIHGFALMDVCSLVRRPNGVLGQADLLFINTSGSLAPIWSTSASVHDAAT